MAKGTADGGAATGTGQEKVQDIKPSGKGGGDVPAAAAGEKQLVIRAPVHCDGCGRKLRRSLQRIEGVGEVTVDSRTNTVVVRGRRAVENATEVLQVVERRTGEKAVLVSPSPDKLPPRSVPNKGGETNKKDDGNTKDVSNELPEVDMEMVTVLKMNLHCDACSEEIRRRILKITGDGEREGGAGDTGRLHPQVHGGKAAIIRAEPLDDLLQSAKSPAPPTVVTPAPPVEAENPPGEKKNGGQNGKKKEEPNEENTGGGQEEDHVDENPETKKPSDGGHGATDEEHGTHAGEAPNHNNGGHHGDEFVLENHTKDDRLFTVPMPAGVVTVAPEMALSNRSYYYPAYPSAQYYFPYQQYQYPQAYPAYACSPAAMYGYGYPANYPPDAFSEENPNACTIV
ncbi:unnamed protein product [Miscanthus lutarioriparius]|uniref:HMA domain-containing protein n=1 Tax=Miscanthus lutarioriparius TaxID=422564 RepID=A0A811N7L7_9POAL|nr:unnamed protein product [Miscanthus lutarioriparius]